MAGKCSFSSFSTSIEHLKAAQVARAQEARLLLGHGLHAGALIMGHLAVEIALKVYICRKNGQKRLADAYKTHDLNELLNAAGLFESASKGVGIPRNTRGSVTISSSSLNIPTPMETGNLSLSSTNPIS